METKQSNPTLIRLGVSRAGCSLALPFHSGASHSAQIPRINNLRPYDILGQHILSEKMNVEEAAGPGLCLLSHYRTNQVNSKGLTKPKRALTSADKATCHKTPNRWKARPKPNWLEFG